ncbi:transposase [Kalymmatonema gypsitolerans NIES-4073]|nr:transposase [Scytonema sp. NIES-4073]BAZ24499.1 transposase [Scytonema sp. NIES-4073]
MSKAYPSNLTLAQYKLMSDLIPEAKPGGRKREVDMWEVRWRDFLHFGRRSQMAIAPWALPSAIATRRFSCLANGLYILSQLA